MRNRLAIIVAFPVAMVVGLLMWLLMTLHTGLEWVVERFWNS